jgi:hypothetical protein
MTIGIDIGDTDLSTVACAAVADRLASIEIDGEALEVILSPVYPADDDELPCILVHSPQETYRQISGRPGQRAQELVAIIRVTLVFATPKMAKSALDIDAGKVRSEIQRRMAADPVLRAGDPAKPVASDLTLQRVDKGFAGGGARTVMVSQLQYSTKIHHREGDHSSTFARAA